MISDRCRPEPSSSAYHPQFHEQASRSHWLLPEHDHCISPVCQRNMFCAVLMVSVECIRMAPLICQSFKCQRRNKFLRMFRHDHLHISPCLYQKTGKISAFVSCYPPCYFPEVWFCPLTVSTCCNSFLSCYTSIVIVLYPYRGNDNKEELNNERKNT